MYDWKKLGAIGGAVAAAIALALGTATFTMAVALVVRNTDVERLGGGDVARLIRRLNGNRVNAATAIPGALRPKLYRVIAGELPIRSRMTTAFRVISLVA